jgi:hypothetical protein
MQRQHYGSEHSSHSSSPNHKLPHNKKKKENILASSTLSSYSSTTLVKPAISKNHEKLQTNLHQFRRSSFPQSQRTSHSSWSNEPATENTKKKTPKSTSS